MDLGQRSNRLAFGAAAFLGLLVAGAPDGAVARGTRFCTATANAQLAACRSEVKDDYSVARALCTNLADDAARTQCFEAARTERGEGGEDCRDQHDARRLLRQQLPHGPGGVQPGRHRIWCHQDWNMDDSEPRPGVVRRQLPEIVHGAADHREFQVAPDLA